MDTGNPQKATRLLQRRLENVDALFWSIEQDKSLPTFGEHFVQCLLAGTARNVDLMEMYPEVYCRLTSWLEKYGDGNAKRG